MRASGGAFLSHGEAFSVRKFDELHAEDLAEGRLGGMEDGFKETGFRAEDHWEKGG